MQDLKNSINWFEIPVADFGRATKFYGALYQTELYTDKMGDFDMGFLPMSQEDKTAVGGALVAGDGYVPSQEGTVVYLNGGDDLQAILDRVEGAGGKVLVPKFEITPEYGHCAFFLDSEGNKVGIHSMN